MGVDVTGVLVWAGIGVAIAVGDSGVALDVAGVDVGAAFSQPVTSVRRITTVAHTTLRADMYDRTSLFQFLALDPWPQEIPLRRVGRERLNASVSGGIETDCHRRIETHVPLALFVGWE